MITVSERTTAINEGATRRSFLKGVGLAFAGAAVAGLSGCGSPTVQGSGQGANTGSSTAATPAAHAVVADDVSWDAEADIVVVGAGVAGLAAAATVASEGNGATCILLEKDVQANGNSPFCYGNAIYTDDADTFFTYLKELTGEETDEAVLRVFADEYALNKEWCAGLGADLSEAFDIGCDWGGGQPYPELESSKSFGVFGIGKGVENPQGADHVWRFFEDYVRGASDVVDYRTSTPFVDFVQGVDGTILGVITADGQNIRADKGVVMALGGFESDPEMVANFFGNRYAIPAAGRSNTGDGFAPCARVGADFYHMHCGATYWTIPFSRNEEQMAYGTTDGGSKALGITVGQNGWRFYWDADCAYISSGGAYGDNLSTSEGAYHGAMNFGGEYTHLPMPQTSWFIFDSDALASGAIPAMGEGDDPETSGWAYSADTIEDLAAQIGVPAENLVETVQLWNDACAAGKDVYFHRSEDTLNPVAKAPFYAMVCRPVFLNSDGGPKRDEHCQILSTAGTPIPGLYGAGEFSSFWGKLYAGAGNIGECMISGRLAVRHALGL